MLTDIRATSDKFGSAWVAMNVNKYLTDAKGHPIVAGSLSSIKKKIKNKKANGFIQVRLDNFGFAVLGVEMNPTIPLRNDLLES